MNEIEQDDDMMNEPQWMESSESSFVEDSSEQNTDKKVGTIASFVEERFSRAKDGRRADEERWLTAYRNYRGLYGPDVTFTDTEKSRVFVKVTKTKVLAAYGQIVDVLFGNNKFPLTIDPTTLPEGISDSVHFESNPQAQAAETGTVSFNPDEKKLRPGETLPELKLRLGSLKDKLAPVADILKDGPGTTPTSITFHPAMVSAKKMEKKIHDQLEESNAKKKLRMSAFECALFGTGVMKGPFAEDKEYASWDEDGTYNPTVKTVPRCDSVSVWNFYPDPDASSMEESEFTVERHKLSRSRLRALKRRPFFRSDAIDKAIAFGEDYIKEDWEQVMSDESTETSLERFQALEFWGYVDTEVLKNHDVKLDKDLLKLDQVSVNVWVVNGQVIRLVINPFTPQIIPYYVFPYEVNPYSMFGIGLAENMEDTQLLMNGFMRMAVDNAALSGNLIFEIDETNLSPGQDLKVYPGKVFKRQGGAPGQSIFGTKFPNVSNENMQMFDKARVLADESTGFPSYAHGQTGVQGVGRTASGISMLMGAASGSIKTVVKNVDDYLLEPLGKAFFNFNMQFDFDPSIKGDLEVKAQGTQSLMANEVRSQRLMQLLGVVQNPALAPFAKMDYIIREIAKSMDLDPDKVANSLSDAALQAEILKKFQGDQQGVGPNVPAGVQATDTQGSGGGNIGTGSVPTPGEKGFSGNAGTPPAPEQMAG